ncbi:hypothetical protein C4559_04165 [Candidatus Microgenomates bacterium]|nr:MAG: hypothetical protein C4559_04165 [Candidatus Microgenomates bacterium]
MIYLIKKPITKIFVVTIMFVVCSFVLVDSVKAADLEINCSQKECIKSTDQPLFNPEDGLWFPGKSVSKSIILKNSTKTQQEVTVKNNQKHQENDLEGILYLTFKNDKKNNVTWEGSLTKFYSRKSISLGKLKPGQSLEILAGLKMLDVTSLDYQDQKAVFDLTFSFSGDNPKDKLEKKKKAVLGESTEKTHPWILNIFSTLQSLLSRIAGIFSR